jgi:xylan 1,4-beta-xylosidase
MAGLVAFYEVDNYYYLRISRDEMAGKSLAILTSIDGHTDEPLEDEVSIEGWDKCYLKVEINRERMQFYYSADGEMWQEIGPVFDASTLADEFMGKLKFTGSMLGVCVQDLSGRKKHADFDFFEYRELE